METGAISTKIERGKHTTRHSELFAIDENSYIMDTPGFSSLYVNDYEKEDLKYFFPEFRKYEGMCKFNGCDHVHEPGCAVKAALEEMGYTCEYYAFSDSNDLATITTNAATNSDVIYVPTDNTVAANTEIVNNICQPAKVPVIAGEEGICSGCGVATLSISYYDLGVATGKMAVKILTGEANVSEMPIEYAPQFTKKYNKTICDALEITVPDDYVAIEE